MIEHVSFQSLNAVIAGESHFRDDGRRDTPLVVLLTGDGSKGISSSTWPPLIEALTNAGLSVFGFDFHGLGRSSGKRAELTISRGSRNLEDAIIYLRKANHLEGRQIAVVASSFGAAALLNSTTSLSLFNAMVLKSPVSSPVETYTLEVGGPANVAAWKLAGISQANGLSYDAYVEATRLDLYANASGVRVPVLIIHGDADTIVPITQSRKLINALAGPHKLITIPAGGHDYKSPGALETFIHETVVFLRASLK